MEALEKYRAYKAGKLSEAEAHEFEKWLLDNEGEALALEGLLEYPENELAADVQEVKQWVNEQKTVDAKRPKYYKGLIAASLVLFVAWTTGLFDNKNAQLYDQYYTKYQVEDGAVRGENDNKQAKAVALYHEGNCALLEIFIESEKGVGIPSANLLLGVCLMESEEYKKALDQFTKSPENQTESIAEAIQWYATLCHLQLDNMDKAKEIATTLVDGKGFYARDAQSLLNELN